MDLLALGTALWFPEVIVWAALGLMMLGEQLRRAARGEAAREGFGDAYRSYCGRTSRFIPRDLLNARPASPDLARKADEAPERL